MSIDGVGSRFAATGRLGVRASMGPSMSIDGVVAAAPPRTVPIRLLQWGRR